MVVSSVLRRLLLTLAVLALIFVPALYLVYADYRAFLVTPLGVPAGGLTLEEIAERLGYGEVSNFIHAFKRWKGVAPRRFQRGA